MKWDKFLKAAYLQELDKSFLWKVNRWLGLRFSYVFYNMKFSANMLSIFRCLLAIMGFYLLSLIKVEMKYQPIVGALILAWQVNLDFADGSIARVQGKSTQFGEEVDGFANALSRFMLIVLLGSLTDNLFILVVSIFTAYTLIVFTRVSQEKVKIYENGPISSFYRIMLSVPMMVVFLPLIVGVFSILGINIIPLSYLLVFLYSIRAFVFLYKIVNIE